MLDDANAVLVRRVQITHGWIIKITTDLTDAQFAWRLSETGPPPIGWHLWHVSRWADRLHASLPGESSEGSRRGDPNEGIWEKESLAARWELNTDLLGLLETGVLMDKVAASLLPAVGKDKLLAYARRTFTAVDQGLAGLDAGQFSISRQSILAIQVTGDSASVGPGVDTTVAGDIGFHLSHASRHLGMIEVIRGMQGLRGTATI